MAKRDQVTGKLDAWIGRDDRNDLTADLARFIEEVNSIGELWTCTRDARSTAVLKEVLGEDLLNMLDELADIRTCEHARCFELCEGDWDFCKRHGGLIPRE